MNHGIKVFRHVTMLDLQRHGQRRPGHLHRLPFFSEPLLSDAQLIAELLCMRLHDDELTSTLAKNCHTVHLWPLGGHVRGLCRLIEPDPVCVTRRTKALERWHGKRPAAALALATDY